MDFTLNYIRTEDDPKSQPVKLGWLIDADKSSVIYPPPERFRLQDVARTHSKSASRCPAMVGLESRYVVVRSPFDLSLEFGRDKDGRPSLRNLLGDKSGVRANKLRELVVVVGEREWRFPDRPTIQVKLPYIFMADEPCYITQVPPFFHYKDSDQWPGTLFAGRFPIDVWPRHLMFAFEWHNIEKPLTIRRGEPMFYAYFEFDNPERNFQLMEIEKTPELSEYLDAISGAVNYVNQSFSLFKDARRIRPETLVNPKKR